MRWMTCLFAICAVAPSCAQAGQDDWNNLHTLHRGQGIQVMDQNMKTWSGKFDGLTGESISIRMGKPMFRSETRTIPRSSVYTVRTSSRMRNALIGLAAGAGAGAGLAAYEANRIDKGYGGAISKGATATVLLIVCTGVGAAAGAAFPSHKTIYRALPEATPKVTAQIDPATYLFARR